MLLWTPKTHHIIALLIELHLHPEMVVRTATKAMIALYPYPWIFNQSHRYLQINYYRFFSFKNAGKKVPVMYENFGSSANSS